MEYYEQLKQCKYFAKSRQTQSSKSENYNLTIAQLKCVPKMFPNDIFFQASENPQKSSSPLWNYVPLCTVCHAELCPLSNWYMVT